MVTFLGSVLPWAVDRLFKFGKSWLSIVKKFQLFFRKCSLLFFFSYNCHYSGNRPHLNPFILYVFPFCLLSSESFLQLFPNPSIEFFVSVSLVKCLKKKFFFTLVSASSIFMVFIQVFFFLYHPRFLHVFFCVFRSHPRFLHVFFCVRVSVSPLRAGVPSPRAVDWYQSVA